MAMRPDEIVAILRRQIEEFETELQVEDLVPSSWWGTESLALWIGKGPSRRAPGIPRGTYGMVLNLEQDNIGVSFWVP